MIDIKIGQQVLITTDNWFVAPDGSSYRAVFGTVHAILNDTETLGIKTNARSTNWYVKVGNMLIAGCQIHYAIGTDSASFDRAHGWAAMEGECKEYTHPSVIYNADQLSPAETTMIERRDIDGEKIAYKVPQNAVGLSDLGDAMRDDAWYTDLVGAGLKHPTDEPAQPLQSKNLRLILERVGSTSRIYYRVQDRITCINKHQGLADGIEAAIDCIPVEDRERVGEERRYGMGVGK